VALAIAGALLGCDSTSINVDGPTLLPPLLPPVGPVTAACGDVPGVLAHLAGIAPGPMITDNANLYVVAAARSGDPARQDLWRIPKNGAPSAPLAADQLRIRALAFITDSSGNASSLYWTACGDDEPDDAGTMGAVSAIGAVWRVDPEGADAAVVVAANRLAPGPLLVAGPDVYWGERAIDDDGMLSGAIAQLPLTGSAVTVVQRTSPTQAPRAFAWEFDSETGGILIWTTADPALGDQRGAEIDECRAGAPFTPVSRVTGPGAGGVGAVAVIDDDFLLYSTSSGIAAAELLGGEGIGAQRGFVPATGFVATIASFGDSIYFVDPGTRALQVAALPLYGVQSAPGPSRALARSTDPATALAVDSSCAYFVDAPSGTLMMVQR
jgi:hypothetical protein